MLRKARITAAVLMAAATTLVYAHNAYSDEEGRSSASKAVDYRTSYMTVLGWHSKPMTRMLKGEMAFDDAAFMHHAKQLAIAARLDLLAGFPEGSITDDTDAKEEIWFEWDDFEQKFADFQAAAKAVGEQADSGDMAATKEAFGKLGEACKACHKAYKQ